MDGGNANNAGAIIGRSHPTRGYRGPEHHRSCASMHPRHTVHPEHKKGAARYEDAFWSRKTRRSSRRVV
ncbi:MAG: hypothetical protein ACI8XV_000152 [Arenicella sp.]|jgi:hypothetical protein